MESCDQPPDMVIKIHVVSCPLSTHDFPTHKLFQFIKFFFETLCSRGLSGS